MRSKIAQVQLTETIAVLFIFFILVSLGILLYGRYQDRQINLEQEKILQDRALQATLQALFLPELQCTNGEADPIVDCIDVLKAKKMKYFLDESVIEDNPDLFSAKTRDYYFDLFSFAKISVVQIYPQSEESERTTVIYDQLKPDGTNSENTFFVVALENKTSEFNPSAFGYLRVEVNS